MSGTIALYAAGHLGEYVALLEYLRPEIPALRFRELIATADILLGGSYHMKYPELERYLSMSSRPSWYAVGQYQKLRARYNFDIDIARARRRYRNFIHASQTWSFEARLRQLLNRYWTYLPERRRLVFEHNSLLLAHKVSQLSFRVLKLSEKLELIDHLMHMSSIENCCKREYKTIDAHAL